MGFPLPQEPKARQQLPLGQHWASGVPARDREKLAREGPRELAERASVALGRGREQANSASLAQRLPQSQPTPVGAWRAALAVRFPEPDEAVALARPRPRPRCLERSRPRTRPAGAEEHGLRLQQVIRHQQYPRTKATTVSGVRVVPLGRQQRYSRENQPRHPHQGAGEELAPH